jgi:hypothetical protein
MKATSKKQLFVQMTPAQAATVNGGSGSTNSKYWNRGAVTGESSVIVFI